MAIADSTMETDLATARGIPRSAYFALFVLVLTNLFNMLDRSIVSILAQSIKADLKLTDADLGFLLGTAFAVFYSVVGIAMGRISDFVSRKKMLAIGLALWSVMTALGGAAVGFISLSAARIGVGVGEAVANPCSHSLLADTFPARNRALALGTYLTGTFLGTATALVVGGLFVQKWPHFCSAIPIGAACHLAGWQAALIAVGAPGLLLALLRAHAGDLPLESLHGLLRRRQRASRALDGGGFAVPVLGARTVADGRLLLGGLAPRVPIRVRGRRELRTLDRE